MPEFKLTLQEQLLLLCVQPRTGELHTRNFREMLSGAALAELLRQKTAGSGTQPRQGTANAAAWRPRH